MLAVWQALLDMLESHGELENVNLDELIDSAMLAVAQDSGKLWWVRQSLWGSLSDPLCSGI